MDRNSIPTQDFAKLPLKEATTEPEFFYMNRETGQCQWQKPDGEFQYTFAEIQNTFAEMYHHSVTAGSVLDKLLFFSVRIARAIEILSSPVCRT